jgi:hypothetical protein
VGGGSARRPFTPVEESSGVRAWRALLNPALPGGLRIRANAGSRYFPFEGTVKVTSRSSRMPIKDPAERAAC